MPDTLLYLKLTVACETKEASQDSKHDLNSTPSYCSLSALEIHATPVVENQTAST
jgi:hypothetical protein